MNKIKWWLKRNFKYLFKIKQMVSDLVYELMLDNNPKTMYLSRFDINSFYPSIMMTNNIMWEPEGFQKNYEEFRKYNGGYVQAFNNGLYGIMEEKRNEKILQNNKV